MKIGFTGTQYGMTHKQYSAIVRLLNKLSKEDEVTEVHHGDCIGADADMHGLVLMNFENMVNHIHPPTDPKKRDFSLGDEKRIVWYEEKEYIERNHDIVDATDILVATPKDVHEELRSGTWATIRYARKMNKPIHIVYSDGSVKFEDKDEDPLGDLL